VDEVPPPVDHGEPALRLLGAGLGQELQAAAVVQLPHHPVGRKGRRLAERRAGAVLAQAGRVDHQAAPGSAGRQAVAVRGRRHELVPEQRGVQPAVGVHPAQVLQPPRIGVGADDPGRTVVPPGQVPGDGGAGAARAQAHHLATGRGEVPAVEELLHRQARGQRVLGVADEPTVTLGDRGDLAAEPGEGVQLVEQVRRRLEQPHLVRRDQGAEMSGVVPDRSEQLPVDRVVGVQRHVVPHQPPGRQVEQFGPAREHPHHRGAPGGDADEPHRELIGAARCGHRCCHRRTAPASTAWVGVVTCPPGAGRGGRERRRRARRARRRWPSPPCGPPLRASARRRAG
jgi:hypothetical protein